MRLLDAADDGADWREAVEILFGICPIAEPERARRIHDTHLARARWMTEHGYRQLRRAFLTDISVDAQTTHVDLRKPIRILESPESINPDVCVFQSVRG